MAQLFFKDGRRSNQRKRSSWPSHIQGSVKACHWTRTSSALWGKQPSWQSSSNLYGWWGREQMSQRNSHLMSASRMANGDGEWLNQCHRSDETRCRGACRGWRMAMVNASSMRSSAMSDVFTVLFTFLVHFWLVIYKVILVHTTFTCLLQLLSTCGIFRLAHSTFSRAVRFLLSRRQHAPNKRCALNNDVRLITRFYSIYIVILDAVCSPRFLNEKLRSDMNNRKRKKKWQWSRNGMKYQLLKSILTRAERKQQLINR